MNIRTAGREEAVNFAGILTSPQLMALLAVVGGAAGWLSYRYG